MARAVVMAAGTTDVEVDTAGPRRYMGFYVKETAGATAEIFVRNGTVTGGQLDGAVLAANGTGSHWLGPNGVAAPDGIYLERVSGTTLVIVYVD